MIPKTVTKQLKSKEFVNEAIDKKEAKIPKAADKEFSNPFNEDTEAQSQKISSNTKIFLATIFCVFLGIAAMSTVAYFSYQDGRQNGMISILKVVKARTQVEYEKDVDFDGITYWITPYENSQIEILHDIMAIAMKYEDKCKGSEYYNYKFYNRGAYYVVKDCFEKLKEKHYLVSFPYKFPNTASATFLQLWKLYISLLEHFLVK